MAKTYSQDQAQNSEENVAKKLDGRFIPFAGVALFVLVAVILSFFVVRRNNAPTGSPDAVQNAPVAVPAGGSTNQ